jgi:hypothetical protein
MMDPGGRFPEERAKEVSPHAVGFGPIQQIPQQPVEIDLRPALLSEPVLDDVHRASGWDRGLRERPLLSFEFGETVRHWGLGIHHTVYDGQQAEL